LTAIILAHKCYQIGLSFSPKDKGGADLDDEDPQHHEKKRREEDDEGESVDSPDEDYTLIKKNSKERKEQNKAEYKALQATAKSVGLIILVFGSPVWSGLLVPSALDRNHNWSSQFEKLQKPRLNRNRPVLTSSGLNRFVTGLDRSLCRSGGQETIIF
jgi:hypothetical protein